MTQKMQALFDDSSLWVDPANHKVRGTPPLTCQDIHLGPDATHTLIVHGQDNKAVQHHGFAVLCVSRLENARLWRQYDARRQDFMQHNASAEAIPRVDSWRPWQVEGRSV